MGIHKRRRKRDGKLRYGVTIDRDGHQVWVGTFETLAEARRAQRAAQDERDEPRPQPPALALTCDAWVDEWLEDVRRQRKPSTYRTHRDAVRKFRGDFRGKALHALTREEARRWAQRNAWQVSAVVACLNAAVEAEHIDRNPMRGMSHRGPGRRHIPPPSVEEIEALAAAAQEVDDAYGSMMRADSLPRLHRSTGGRGVRPGVAERRPASPAGADRQDALPGRAATA